MRKIIKFRGKKYHAATLADIQDRDDFIGLHCQARPRASIDQEDTIGSGQGQGKYGYGSYVPEILDSLSFDLRDIALEKGWMENPPGEYDDGYEDWLDEVYDFLDDHGIKWIFVSENKPLTDYGDYCYGILLPDKAVLTVIPDIGVDDAANAYVYNANVAIPSVVEIDEEELEQYY